MTVVGVHKGRFYEGGGGRRIKSFRPAWVTHKKELHFFPKNCCKCFPFAVCSSYVYIHLLGKLIAVDGQEDDFCLSCIILMNRNTLE